MSQVLKSKLCMIHSCTVQPHQLCVAMDGQVCFHEWLFAGPVKLCWCITGPVGPLGSTNQNWLCQTAANGHLGLSCGLCTFLLSAGNTALLLSVAQWQGGPTFSLPTHPHHPCPLPPTHPLISDTRDIIMAVKNYL